MIHKFHSSRYNIKCSFYEEPLQPVSPSYKAEAMPQGRRREGQSKHRNCYYWQLRDREQQQQISEITSESLGFLWRCDEWKRERLCLRDKWCAASQSSTIRLLLLQENRERSQSSSFLRPTLIPNLRHCHWLLQSSLCFVSPLQWLVIAWTQKLQGFESTLTIFMPSSLSFGQNQLAIHCPLTCELFVFEFKLTSLFDRVSTFKWQGTFDFNLSLIWNLWDVTNISLFDHLLYLSLIIFIYVYWYVLQLKYACYFFIFLYIA